MNPCTAREFVETNGRTGTMDQFKVSLKAAAWGLKADIWASVVPDSMVAAEFSKVAAQFAFIAFPDLRA